MAVDPKRSLTPQEKIKAAYLHEVRGIQQSDIAVAFEVNIGRVNEALMEIRQAVGLPTPDHKDRDQ